VSTEKEVNMYKTANCSQEHSDQWSRHLCYQRRYLWYPGSTSSSHLLHFGMTPQTQIPFYFSYLNKILKKINISVTFHFNTFSVGRSGSSSLDRQGLHVSCGKHPCCNGKALLCVGLQHQSVLGTGMDHYSP
jgi:hypothetical protein